MSGLTRRNFLATSAVTAAAAGAAAVISPASAHASPRRADAHTGEGSSGGAPAGTVLYVRNAETAELVVFDGEREFVVTDSGLLQAIGRATSGKG